MVSVYVLRKECLADGANVRLYQLALLRANITPTINVIN